MAVLALEQYAQKRHSKATETATTTKFLKYMANEDILLEVFTRLPNARDVLHCAAVCKRWRSVISHPQFVPTFTRKNQSQPFTLLFSVGFGDGFLFPTAPMQRPIRELFSKDSKTLYGVEKLSGKSKYLDFLPLESIVRASNKDLLLVTPQQEPRQMCVCNPLTRQWVPLPEPPLLLNQDRQLEDNYLDRHGIHHYALLCHHNNHYTVLVSRKDMSQTIFHAAVFRSETGRWDDLVRTFPIGDGHDRLAMPVVGTNDGAIYTPQVRNLQDFEKIVVFDPFDVMIRGLAYREILLPTVGFKRGWRGLFSRCRIGAVRGRLRLWQSYFDKRMNKFVFIAWQLEKKYGKWVLVHDLRLAKRNESKFTDTSGVIALHPHDDDVFFFKDDNPSIWEYHIRSGSCENIGEIDKIWSQAVVYTVVHQPWPTVIPQQGRH